MASKAKTAAKTKTKTAPKKKVVGTKYEMHPKFPAQNIVVVSGSVSQPKVVFDDGDGKVHIRTIYDAGEGWQYGKGISFLANEVPDAIKALSEVAKAIK